MAYVIAAPCVADYSCVEICPVDCIRPLPSEAGFDTSEQLFIDPTVCINCGACMDVCPVLAIYDAGNLPAKWKHYEQINRDYFQKRGKSGA